MIAALFVETGGVYFGLSDVDPYDVRRDARAYAGPDPVITHSPCQLWGALAFVNFKRWGGEHNRPGNDGGCFASAVKNVRVWCGVLEHPAFSRAWARYGLVKPNAAGWRFTGMGPGKRQHWVCEVWQSAYGHKARKRTWLYYVGFQKPFDLKWERLPGTHQCGQPDQRGKARNKPSLTKREASATPPAFRDTLIKLAHHSRGWKESIGKVPSIPSRGLGCETLYNQQVAAARRSGARVC
jgi:hypothetical protein